MRLIKATALALCVAMPAMADGHGPKIYPYHTHTNYCPAGQQPVTMDGVICCGVPNQAHTYQQVMANPRPAKRVHRVQRVARTYRDNCPVGAKGCN